MSIDSTNATQIDLESFRDLVALQQPIWPDHDRLAQARKILSASAPIVVPAAADKLRQRRAAGARGAAFRLQGGDCAESLAGADAGRISNKIRTILQMAVVLTHGASVPVVKMGRMAGQFAKPRSSNTEIRDGIELPAYRGDMVNGFDFTEESRIPDPFRMVEGYRISSATLNLIQAFTQGGFADLRRVHEWNHGFLKNPAYKRYERTAKEIDRAIKFMAACGADFGALRTVDFFVGHEALLLDYEHALTRVDTRTGRAYDTSAHFLWIGERTRQLDGAHVEFLSKVSNPLGIKLGPTTSADEMLALADKLDPEREPGRLTFITRMGAGNIRSVLPGLLAAAKREGLVAAWATDPMHGNTITSATGYKTRRFSDVLDEVVGFFEVHRAIGTVPGGLHMELTGDDVTEVLGGSEEIDDEGLAQRYETLVDPRLNHQQSLELAFLVAEMIVAS